MFHLKPITKNLVMAQTVTLPTKAGLTVDLVVDVLEAFKPLFEAKELEDSAS